MKTEVLLLLIVIGVVILMSVNCRLDCSEKKVPRLGAPKCAPQVFDWACADDEDCHTADGKGYCMANDKCCMPVRSASECEARAKQIVDRTSDVSPPMYISGKDCCPKETNGIKWQDSYLSLNYNNGDVLREDLPLDTVMCNRMGPPYITPNEKENLYVPAKFGGKCCPCPEKNRFCMANTWPTKKFIFPVKH